MTSHFVSLSLPDVTDEMLAFFLTLFQALRVQMGVAFTGQIIHTFLSMFTRLKAAQINTGFKMLSSNVRMMLTNAMSSGAGSSWQPVFCKRAARAAEWCRSS